MTMGDLIVGGIIAVMVILAIYVLIRNKRSGRNSCGCKCSGCCQSQAPNVITIDDSCDCCKKE